MNRIRFDLGACIRFILLVLILGNVTTSLVVLSKPLKKEIKTATELRLLDPGWWPNKTSFARDDYTGPQVCARCHADIALTQGKTQMDHALSAANATALPEISSGPIPFNVGLYHYQITPIASGASYSVTDGVQTLSVPIGWIFGNGAFGKTYVYEQDGKFYESRISYYNSVKLLDFTTGNPRSAPDKLENALGRRMVPDEAASCFGCHTTAAVANDHFDEKRMIPGVTCEACHGPGAKHVANMDLGMKQLSIMNPADLGPVDAVDFCGACHRTSVDVSLSGFKGVFTLRFPAYRLENSRCWGTSGDSKLTCTACHNPHQPLVRDAGSYDKNCLSCHTGTSVSKSTSEHPKTAAVVCPVAKTSCVTCHMPKFNIPEMHTTFTDHKIAIHRTQGTLVD